MMIDIKKTHSMLREAWSQHTSSDEIRWSPSNPALGQCAVTACYVQEKYGGDIIRVEYETPIGEKGSHYYNILSLNKRVDLTVSQFPVGTTFLPALTCSDEELVMATKSYLESKDFKGSVRDYILSFESTKKRYNILSLNMS